MTGPGCSQTCPLCHAVIETPARPLVMEGKECGSVIDLNQNAQDFADHYASEHPGVDVPGGVW